MKLTLRIREVPPDHRGGYDLATGEVVVEAETYEDAKAQALAQVPDGWQSIWIDVDRA